jgi:hypothetical protein
MQNKIKISEKKERKIIKKTKQNTHTHNQMHDQFDQNNLINIKK